MLRGVPLIRSYCFAAAAVHCDTKIGVAVGLTIRNSALTTAGRSVPTIVPFAIAPIYLLCMKFCGQEKSSHFKSKYYNRQEALFILYGGIV